MFDVLTCWWGERKKRGEIIESMSGIHVEEGENVYTKHMFWLFFDKIFGQILWRVARKVLQPKKKAIVALLTGTV